MEIQEERHGGVTVIRPIGPMIQQDAEQVRKRAIDALPRCLGRLVIDVSAVQYVDSKGLESLLAVTDALQKSAQVLRLCGANETLREVLELTEISPRFDFYRDVGDGVRSWL
jgi:anti-sigma B factor antagonist